MTRTIYIVFSKKYNGVSWEPNIGARQYAFLCNYDIVKKNDIILDPRYNSPMLVVEITSNTNRVQNGITLKDIYITMINDKLIYQPSGLVNGSIPDSNCDIDLIKSKEKKYLGEGDKIYCSTPEEARKVIDIYYTLGYQWYVTPRTETNYSAYRNRTVYNIRDKKYIMCGSVEAAKYCNKNIIPAKEFINYYTAKEMEKRNIKVTLDQAIEWFNSGNETLRTLALTIYTEEELTLNRNYIFSRVKDTTATLIPSVDDKRFLALADLAVIAKYFNGDWKKTANNTGYFLGQSSREFTYDSTDIKGTSITNLGIVKHDTMMYPGIVYFKEEKDILKAIKIMGSKIEDLF